MILKNCLNLTKLCYNNLMLNDIKDEPEILRKLAEVYLPAGKNVQNIEILLNEISKIYIVASGSSRNAGNIAKYFIESITRIPVIVEHASEFGTRNPVLYKDDLVIFVSQSGETSDVLAALQIAKNKGACTFAITNNSDSTIHKAADSAMFIHAGKETSIPATKSFIAQLVCLFILGVYIAEKNNKISPEEIQKFCTELNQMPEKLEKLISNTQQINSAAEKLFNTKSLVILGKGQGFGLADEAALKIKETCYINTAGYPTGEFLHGHLAMIDEGCPVVSILLKNDTINHNIAVGNTLKLINKRDAHVFAVKDVSDDYVSSKFAGHSVEYIDITASAEVFSSVYAAVVLHLLAYKMAELLGHDVNNPRSLTKTVSND